MFISFKELIKEKEHILESLRKETINNEEKKNYIEILKQSLESTILKVGLGPLLNSQRVHYNKDVSNVDIFIDASLIKAESERFRKELLLSQILNNELKQEYELIKKNFEDIIIKNQKLKEEMQNLLGEIEHKENYIKNQEEEKSSLGIEINRLSKNNENLLHEIDKINQKNKMIEKDLLEMNKKNIEANNQVIICFVNLIL